MVNRKDRKNSGRKEENLVIPKKVLIENELDYHVKSYWDDWNDWRDGFRRTFRDKSKFLASYFYRYKSDRNEIKLNNSKLKTKETLRKKRRLRIKNGN